MGVEGHPWDSALFTGAVAHVESYQRDVAVLDSAYTSFQSPKLPMPQGWLALCTFLASASVFVWLQLASIALRPLSAKLVPSHAWCHQRSKGPWHPLLPNPRNFGQHRCWITGATTHGIPKQAESQLHMVTLWERAPLFVHPVPTFSLALPACLSTILEMLAPFVSAMVLAAR